MSEAGWVLAIDFGPRLRAGAVQDRGQIEIIQFANMASIPESDGIGVAEAYARLLAAAVSWAGRGRAVFLPARLVLIVSPGWGDAKRDALQDAARIAVLPAPEFQVRPIAAARHLAAQTSPGALFGILDMSREGAETTIVRRTRDGFELVGAPGGLPNASAGGSHDLTEQGAYELLATIAAAGLAPGQLDSVYITGQVPRPADAVVLAGRILGATIRVSASGTAALRGAFAADPAPPQRSADDVAGVAGVAGVAAIRRRPARRAWTAAAVGVAAAVAVAIYLSVPSATSSAPPATSPPPAAESSSPAAETSPPPVNMLLTAAVVSGGPVSVGVAADSGHVWVTNVPSRYQAYGTVFEMSASGTPIRSIRMAPGFTYPLGIADDGTHLWVTDARGSSVAELDVKSGRLVQTISGAGYDLRYPHGVIVGGGHVWIANSGGKSVVELNGGNGSLVRDLSGSGYGFSGPAELASDGPDIFATNSSGNSVTEFNAASGAFVKTISGSEYGFDQPSAIAASGADVWVANGTNGGNGGSVTEFNAGSGRLVRVISGPKRMFTGSMGIAVVGPDVMLSNTADGLQELNASSGDLVRAITGPTTFAGTCMITYGVHLWVCNGTGGPAENQTDGTVTEFDIQQPLSADRIRLVTQQTFS